MEQENNKPKSATVQSELRHNARKNYYRFEDEQLSLSVRKIYDNAPTIFFYKTVSEFLRSDFEIEPKVVKLLAGQGETIIDNLYDFYDDEFHSIQSDEDILHLINLYYEDSVEKRMVDDERAIDTKLGDFIKSYIPVIDDKWTKQAAEMFSTDICTQLAAIEVWQRKDYLFSRLNTCKASLSFLDDIGYICGLDGIINLCSLETEILSAFISKQNSPKGKHTQFDNLTEQYATAIGSFTGGYGFTKENIAEALNKKIAKMASDQEM